MITVQLHELTATYDGDTWRCSSAEVQRALTLTTRDVGATGADPHPAYNVAWRVARILGGVVTSPPPHPPNPPGMIY